MTGRRVLLDPHGRILRGQPGQPLGELVLVAAAVRLDRDRQQRLGQAPRLQPLRRRRIRHGVAHPGRGQLADADQITRHRPVHGALLLAERGGQPGGPLLHRLAVRPGHQQRLVRVQGAGEDPDQAEPADIGVAGVLDHLGDQRGVRVGALVGGQGFGQRAVRRRREGRDDQVQQVHRAGAVLGQRQHGVDRVVQHRPAQAPGQRAGVQLLAAEVGLQQLVVLTGDRLHQPLPGRLGRRQRVGLAVRLAGEQFDRAAHPAVAAHRQVHGLHGVRVPVGEGLLTGRQHLVEVGPGRIHMGDGDGAGQPGPRALLPERQHRTGHRVGRGDGEDRRVGGPQRGAQLTGEIGVAGRVQQVDLDAPPFDRDQREPHRALLLMLDLLEVRDGAALADLARPGERTRGQGQRLGERGLAGAAHPDQHHVAQLLRPRHGRCLSGGSGAGRGALGHRGSSGWRWALVGRSTAELSTATGRRPSGRAAGGIRSGPQVGSDEQR